MDILLYGIKDELERQACLSKQKILELKKLLDIEEKKLASINSTDITSFNILGFSYGVEEYKKSAVYDIKDQLEIIEDMKRNLGPLVFENYSLASILHSASNVRQLYREAGKINLLPDWFNIKYI
jgi:hypothetical protein